MNRFERQLQKRKRRWWLWGLLFILCVSVGWGAAWLFTPRGEGRYSTTPWNIIKTGIIVVRNPYLIFNERPRVNILFLGRDRDYDNYGRVMNTTGRADTILIVALEKDTSQASLVSIPRDTLARVPGHGAQKINAAHSIGGPQLMIQTLKDSLGIHVDHYAVFKFEGFKKAIDAVGGVDIEVPKNMDYDDKWAHLRIHLKKGWQHLDGAKAHGFVRFRHDRQGDLGRIERQQMLAKALAKKMLTPSMVLNIPDLIPTLRECVDTDLADEQLFSLAFFMRKVKLDALKTEVLPGTWVSPYLVPHREKSAEILARTLGATFDQTVWEIQAATLLSAARSGHGAKKKSKHASSQPESVDDAATQPEAIPSEPETPPGSPENLPAPPPPSEGGGKPPSSATDSHSKSEGQPAPGAGANKTETTG